MESVIYRRLTIQEQRKSRLGTLCPNKPTLPIERAHKKQPRKIRQHGSSRWPSIKQQSGTIILAVLRLHSKSDRETKILDYHRQRKHNQGDPDIGEKKTHQDKEPDVFYEIVKEE